MTPAAPPTALHVALQAALQAADPGVPAHAAQALAPLGQQQHLPRNAPLLVQGQTWAFGFVILSGLVRLHFVRRDGREFNKNFFAEGALVCPLTPEMWGAPSLFGIACIEPTRIWRCDAAQLRATLAAHGAWDGVQRALLARLLSAKLQREHDLLAYPGRARYEAFCARYPQWATRVPLMHLATYLGLTDVSLSRLRRGGASSAPPPPY